MVKIAAVYDGDLSMTAKHLPSGSEIHTDAPVDNQGKGRYFSPTDLVATALGTCIVTTMAMVANRHKVDMGKTKVSIEKHMVSEPVRRIGKIVVNITLPATIPEKERTVLERVAHQCPVHHSLHPDIQLEIKFIYE